MSKRFILFDANDYDREKFLDDYLHEMGKVGYEIFGIRYMDDYVNRFPIEDEQAVRDSLTRFAESFHKGHNALPVIILLNKYYIKSYGWKIMMLRMVMVI